MNKIKDFNKVIFAGSVGTVFEWYDFFIYNLAAVLIFNQIFFPNIEPTWSLIVSMMSYAVGVIARPLGGIIYGVIGDKFGRKKMLITTMLLMGVSTFLIGLLPTYTQIGIWAPIALIFLRICQGIGLGGEWGGAAILIQEHSPSDRRGFYSSFIQLGLPIGMLLASGVFALLSWNLTDSQILEWGWRIPFLISAVLVLIGAHVRSRIPETPVFLNNVKTHRLSDSPLKDLLLKHPKILLKGITLKLTESAWFFIVTSFIVGYAATKFNIPKKELLPVLMIANSISIVWTLVVGYLSDIVGRKFIFYAGSLFTVLFSFPLFYLVETGEFNLIALSIIIGQCIGSTTMFAILSSYLPEIFPSQVRGTGSSLSFQVGAAIGGGVLPVLAAYAVGYFGSNFAVACALALFGIATFITTYYTRETYKIDVLKLDD